MVVTFSLFLVKSCLTITPYTPEPCAENREADLTAKRQLYRLTKPKATVPNYPVTENNLVDFLTFPILNMSSKHVVGLALSNPDERGWAAVYLEMAGRNRQISGQTQNLGEFTSYDNYTDLMKFYRAKQHVSFCINRFLMIGHDFRKYNKHDKENDK